MIAGSVFEHIDHRMMATGLAAIVAPLLGLLADRLGVGAAVLIIGGSAVVGYPLVRVRE